MIDNSNAWHQAQVDVAEFEKVVQQVTQTQEPPVDEAKKKVMKAAALFNALLSNKD